MTPDHGSRTTGFRDAIARPRGNDPDMTEATTPINAWRPFASSSPGIPASGRPVQWDAIDIYPVTDDGQISEQWPSWLPSAVMKAAFTLSWEGLRR